MPSEAEVREEDVSPTGSTEVGALSGDTAVGVETWLVPKSVASPKRTVVCVGAVA